MATKELLRGAEWRKHMHEITKKEKEQLKERMTSEEAMERLMAKFGSKSKL